MTSMITSERFWAKVDKAGECWLWTASLSHGGYGQFNDGTTIVRAHRWAYESEAGPIPDGMTLDHLCRVRHCVRPSHLEPVTRGENVRRGVAYPQLAAENAMKTECPKGHPYDNENTYITPRGSRDCRKCRGTASTEWRKRNGNVKT